MPYDCKERADGSPFRDLIVSSNNSPHRACNSGVREIGGSSNSSCPLHNRHRSMDPQRRTGDGNDAGSGVSQNRDWRNYGSYVSDRLRYVRVRPRSCRHDRRAPHGSG